MGAFHNRSRREEDADGSDDDRAWLGRHALNNSRIAKMDAPRRRRRRRLWIVMSDRLFSLVEMQLTPLVPTKVPSDKFSFGLGCLWMTIVGS